MSKIINKIIKLLGGYTHSEYIALYDECSNFQMQNALNEENIKALEATNKEQASKIEEQEAKIEELTTKLTIGVQKFTICIDGGEVWVE